MLKKQKEFEYQVIEHIATLSEEGVMSKDLKIISFNGAPAKYDIRNWQLKGDKQIMLKGVALTIEEAKALKEALNNRTEL